MRGLSIGGQVGASYTSQEDASATDFTLGPAVTWYFVQDGRLHPFVRGTAEYVRATISSSGGDATATGLGLTGAAGVLFLLTESVGVNAQLFVSRFNQEFGDLEANLTAGGLRVGVSAFVF